MTDIYEDIGTSKNDPETNKAIRELLDEGTKPSKIERKIIEIDKTTFLTAAARVFRAYKKMNESNFNEDPKSVLEKVAKIGYPLKPFETMNTEECLDYLVSLNTEMCSQLGKY